jgi:hypothetical protein
MKCDMLKGLVLGHMTGAHGEYPREALESIKPYFRFWDLKELGDSRRGFTKS